jgi:nucleoside-diphosphate-sugar epimerase
VTDRYLVTGGAGFIGNHIARALLERGLSVRVFDNFATGHRENLSDLVDEIELVEGDLRSIDACRRAAAGVRYILHQAALPSVPRSIEDPHTTHEVNATGTLHLLIAARGAGVQRVVYASSSSVYGRDPKLPRDEADRPSPVSPYAVSKLAGEQYCSAFYHSYGIETVALRYFNVFGPRQGWDSPYAAAIPRFIRALAKGHPPTVYGDGEQSRDFTYVSNVVDANLLALDAASAPGRMYNVGAGHGTTVNSLLRTLCEIMDKPFRPEYHPPRPGDVRDSVADITRAGRDFGYAAATPLDDGLRPTVDWALATLR